MRPLAAAAAVSCALGVGCGRIAFDVVPGSDALAVDAFACPPGYTRESPTSCYRTGVAVASWLAAEATCEADGYGAHLAVISDAAEAAIVDKYRPSPIDAAWIGVTDDVTEGIYRTVLGPVTTYAVFGAGEPDGVGQNCVLLNPNLLLSDFDCANPDDYICEYDGIAPVSAAWGTCPSGYTWAGTGCYRFVGGSGAGQTWFEGEADCEADGPGRHLVVIDDMAEAAAVDAFVPSSILDHFIGATDLAAEGTFVTVTNQPLAYTTFEPGQPNGGTSQNCLIFTDAQQLNDIDCLNGDDYVCEYDGIAPVPAAWGQ